ncbi:MAG: type II secretion system inner membrane protein GspF [Deltaproteobacteria bacterium]|nr:type II secretion system inner membrane protein GspF [Deltaproteobacteria bacterium]
MPVFVYRGLDASGREVKGMRDAESPKSLRTVLKKEGVRIIEQHEEGGGKKTTKAKAQALAATQVDLKRLFDRVSVAEIALVTRQLAVLLKSGITLIDSLGAIVDQVESEKLKRVFGQIKSQVNEGSSLANAMAQHPTIFADLYVSMIRAGEASGALDQVLVRLADFQEAQARLQSKIMSAMMYPMIMLGLGSIIMLVLFVVVIPRITKIFDQVKAELPLQTKFLIFAADVVKNFWWGLIILAVLGVIGFRRWRRSPTGRPIWDRFLLKAPVLGGIVRLVSVARFSRTLATLLRAGVPVLTALDIVKDVLNNVRLAEVVTEAREAIREGESIADPLRRSREFPPIVVHMIATGEKSGQLETMLENVSDNYDFQVDQKVERLTTLIEPIMIVGMGLVVAFVVWSILMPILQLSQHVR